MTPCGEHGYMQVEGDSIDEAPWRRRHICAAYLGGVLSAGVIVVLSKMVPGDSSTSFVSGEQAQPVNLAFFRTPMKQMSHQSILGESMKQVGFHTRFGQQGSQNIPRYAPQASAGQQGMFGQKLKALLPSQNQPAPRNFPVPMAGGWGAAATDEQLARKVPQLYVYDHCPFCVRARMIFGLKGVEYNLVFLQNDDVRTPTKMIGKKVLPILEDPGILNPTGAIGESLDIVAYIDQKVYAPALLKPASGRADLKAWDKKLKDVRSKLTRPRTARSPLPEFGTRNAAEIWAANHPIKPKGSLTYEEALAKTPEFLAVANEALAELESLIYSPEHISPGGVSYDDIVYFPPLRSLTLIKGVVFGPNVDAYVETMSEKADVPLLWQMAI